MLSKNKTIPIKIPNILGKNQNQYCLKKNLFDPAKNSPPNIFMIKLYNRVKHYEFNHKNDIILETI
jgi:hypothetical protein